MCRHNSTYIVTGHANGCILWSTFAHPAPALDGVPRPFEPPASLTLMPNNSFCPPCGSASHAPSSISHLYLGRVSDKIRKYTAVAVADGAEVLVLQDRGRPPFRTHSEHRILHVHHMNQQARSHYHGFVRRALLD